MQMELQLRSAEVNLPQEIENLEQLKAELVPVLEKYNNLVVTEESRTAAKSDKANLNKLKKAITEQRISIKKQYLEPYTLLENQCKEVIALIDEPLQAIDRQLKAFDDKEKYDKKLKLKTAFYQMKHHSWINFEDVLPEKWANKTEKTEKLISEIQTVVDRINAEYDEITEMYTDSPLLTAIQERYRTSGNKAETLAYAVTLERNQRESNVNTTISNSVSGDIITPATVQTAVKSDSAMISGTFKVTCTEAQLIALRDFMKAEAIEFEVVK